MQKLPDCLTLAYVQALPGSNEIYRSRVLWLHGDMVSSDRFVMLLTAAQRDVLTERQAAIMKARYGVDRIPTLEEIGNLFGVSRERIRQITQTCRRRLGAHGRRDLAEGRANTPCAELVLAARTAIHPEENGEIDRLVDFAADALSHLPALLAYQLLASLIYASKEQAASYIIEAQERLQQRTRDLRASIREQRLARRVQEICSFVIWPPSATPIHTGVTLSHIRAREVNPESEGNTGEYYSDKLRRNVQFESQLELRFLLLLEEAEEIITYQEQPFRIAYGRKGKRSYHPDVLFVLRDGHGVVAEIKCIWQMPLAENLEKLRALRVFTRAHGLGMLITDGKLAIQQILRHPTTPAFAEAVLTQLKKGSLDWKAYSELQQQHERHPHDFPALVLKHKLVWRLSPFCLSHPHAYRRSRCSGNP